MSQNMSKWIILLLGAVSFLVGAALFFYVNGVSFERIEDPLEIYQQGELSQSATERRKTFNHSLNVYNEMERERHLAHGNGKLYYNIANNYFQLGEYPMALLYYYKALKLSPNDSKIQHNLTVAEKKIGLFQPQKKSVFDQILFFHHQYSLPEKIQLFSVILIILFIVWSAYIWMERGWLKGALTLLGVFTVLLLSSLLFTAIFTPTEGVLVKGSNLYRDAGKQYAKVIEEVISAGSKVEIIEVKSDGSWYKIMTPNKQMGYVPEASIRII